MRLLLIHRCWAKAWRFYRIDDPYLDERAQRCMARHRNPTPSDPNQVIFRLECCRDGRSNAIEGIDLMLAHHVTCPQCRTQWRLDLLTEHRHGLRIIWRP